MAANNSRSSDNQNLLTSNEILTVVGHEVRTIFFIINQFTERMSKVHHE